MGWKTEVSKQKTTPKTYSAPLGKRLYDTIIVGAGPVGSYLAGSLAQLGLAVLVLEKKAAVGQNTCCTGIIGKECVDLVAIDKNIITRPASSAKFFSPTGKTLRLWRDDKVAYIIDRPALDLMLANRAQASGADYHLGTQVTDIQIRDDCLRVETDCLGRKKLFEAETVVIATGFGSPLPEKLGLGKIGNFIIGAQAEVEANNLDEVEIYIDQHLAPGGFAWLVPTTGHKGLAGLMTHRQPERHLNNFLLNLKAQDKITSTEVTPGYGVIPLRPLPQTYADRVLVVGEAAGQVKPITGGGIYYGLLCASIAAGSLRQAFLSGDFSKRTLSSYQKLWLARLGKELMVSYWVHQLYAKLSNRQIEKLHNFVARSGIPQFIAEWDDFSFDWHSKLILNMLIHLVSNIPRQTITSRLKQKAATNSNRNLLDM